MAYSERFLLLSFINIARSVNEYRYVAVIIINIHIEVSSIGDPKTGRNGIGNMITSQIPTSMRIVFHLFLKVGI